MLTCSLILGMTFVSNGPGAVTYDAAHFYKFELSRCSFRRPCVKASMFGTSESETFDIPKSLASTPIEQILALCERGEIREDPVVLAPREPDTRTPGPIVMR